MFTSVRGGSRACYIESGASFLPFSTHARQQHQIGYTPLSPCGAANSPKIPPQHFSRHCTAHLHRPGYSRKKDGVVCMERAPITATPLGCCFPLPPQTQTPPPAAANRLFRTSRNSRSESTPRFARISLSRRTCVDGGRVGKSFMFVRLIVDHPIVVVVCTWTTVPTPNHHVHNVLEVEEWFFGVINVQQKTETAKKQNA